MFLRSRFSKVLAIAVAVAALTCVSFADTLHLKDGSILKGKIVAFSGGKFTIVMGEGAHRRELTFAASEIESIKFDEDANVASTDTGRKYEPAKSPVQQQPGQQQSKMPVLISNDNATSQQQQNQKPRFRQWDTGQKQPQVVVTDNSRNNQTVSQKPTVIQSAPRVINANATGSQPGRVDPPKQNTNGGMQPISWDVKVTADNTNNGWTNSGWVVRKGQKIRITGDGTVDLGKGKKSTASGDPDIDDAQKLLKNVATGALIAVIGDDNNDFIYVGSERTFTATRDGALFLGINEGYLDDNKGSYAVKVEILPDDK
jgi:hypothetical protein